MPAWTSLSTESQEAAIGRTKADNIEMDDAVKPSNSHIALNVITDDDGNELDILRDNMPYGYADGERGTFFIAYSRSPEITERMLENMFIGDPPGNTDRLLDFTTAVTGSQYYAPPGDFLDDPPPPPGGSAAAPAEPTLVATTTSAAEPESSARATDPSASDRCTDNHRTTNAHTPPRRHHEQPASRTRTDLGGGLGGDRDRGLTLLQAQRRRAPGRRRGRPRSGSTPRRSGRAAPTRSTRPATASMHRCATRSRSSSYACRSPSPARRSTTSTAVPSRRTGDPVRDAARDLALAEDRAIFEGYAAAGIKGIREDALGPIKLPEDVVDLPETLAEALSKLKMESVDHPYSVAVSADLYNAISETSNHGYPVREHLQRQLVEGDILWAPHSPVPT